MRTFGTVLGPLPKQRAATNGIILRHGYIVAEFGDTQTNDPVYSVAKSFLSTVAASPLTRADQECQRSRRQLHPRWRLRLAAQRPITWKNHLQQESEWEGNMWGKNADFVGARSSATASANRARSRTPGAFYEYNDVRINRFSLSPAAALRQRPARCA